MHQQNHSHHWDCRDIGDIKHSKKLIHERETEDGLPNYEAQQNGDVVVTLCEKCHPRIPGHVLHSRPKNLSTYFEIEDPETLIRKLPSKIVGKGSSIITAARILEACVQDKYNPCQGHAGKTLQISLAYQYDQDKWIPPANNISFENVDWQTYENNRSNWAKSYGINPN